VSSESTPNRLNVFSRKQRHGDSPHRIRKTLERRTAFAAEEIDPLVRIARGREMFLPRPLPQGWQATEAHGITSSRVVAPLAVRADGRWSSVLGGAWCG